MNAPLEQRGSLPGLVRGYQTPARAFDEMLDPEGAVRPHWHNLVRSLDALGSTELARRWEQARRLLHDNGVTYNIHGDDNGMDRPWMLDPLPMIMPSAEWSRIELGLTQRAHLLDLILADLYGPQKLLADGLLPAELVFAHPGFLRPCHGIRVPLNHHLHVYAADIVRPPDGLWRVIADRTQAPIGAGYVLENRIILSRVLPDVFRDCQVRRLASYFHALRQSLAALAPRHKDNPRIVLLTPGPTHETYFEHAYMARYLGYTLVEGGDLAVRDDAVYLKLLGGLQPVDVILRRMDDDLCDPLELRGDSFVGVPGLVQAARAGNVAIVNALGSGIVESPALLPFLPRICRHLLGEELRMPSAASWWCGDPQALQHVIANLPRMVVKPAFPSGWTLPTFGALLTDEQRQQFADALRANPRDYVGQEQLNMSTAPVLQGDGLQRRHAGLRTFLLATGDGYTLMPGGLTRTSSTLDNLVISVQAGGGSKDTWVLSDGPVSQFSLLRPPDQPLELSRGGGDLPSRVADNLFWLGRYIERAEGTVRLLRGILSRVADHSALADVPELPALIRALGQPRHVAPEPEPAPLTDATLQQALNDALFALAPNSLPSTFDAMHRVARVVRDRLSADTWRIVNTLTPLGPAGTDASDLLLQLNQRIIGLAALGGLAMDSSTRGQAWRFLDLGRRIERAIHIISLLRSTIAIAGPHEAPIMEAVLEIADSAMTYRRRYLSSLQAPAVVDLLVADESNPRALAFQLIAMNDHVDHMPRDPADPSLTPSQRIALASLTAVRLADIESLCRTNDQGFRDELDRFLACLADDLPVLSEAISQSYLSHAQLSRQLASLHAPPHAVT